MARYRGGTWIAPLGCNTSRKTRLTRHDLSLFVWQVVHSEHWSLFQLRDYLRPLSRDCVNWVANAGLLGGNRVDVERVSTEGEVWQAGTLESPMT